MAERVFNHCLAIPIIVIGYRSLQYSTSRNRSINHGVNVIDKQADYCRDLPVRRTHKISLRYLVNVENSSVNIELGYMNTSIIIAKRETLICAERLLVKRNVGYPIRYY